MAKLDGVVRVLVTGSAGFLGSHVVDALLAEGHEVAVLDSLVEQVHGPQRWVNGEPVWPVWVQSQSWRDVRLVFGDVRDRSTVTTLLRSFRPDVVVHLAAEVGVGQAERAIERYVDVNVRGTAVLLEAVLAANGSLGEGDRGVRRLVVAGSMSSYGEGMWFCSEHGTVRQQRADGDVAQGLWLPICPHPECKTPLRETLTPEWASLRPAGVYAATKRDQEEYALLVGRSTGLSIAVPRFFNLYGPRQSMTNPYTGVVANFAARCLSGLAPRVYEDGLQMRDFLHVSDAAAAVLALVGPPDLRSAAREWSGSAFTGVFNVGSGVGTTVLDVARLACDVLAPHLRPEVTGSYRIGDTRACVAEPKRLRESLGWSPKVAVKDGLRALFEGWKDSGRVAEDDRLNAAHDEAEAAGLIVGGSEPEEPAAKWGE